MNSNVEKNIKNSVGMVGVMVKIQTRNLQNTSEVLMIENLLFHSRIMGWLCSDLHLFWMISYEIVIQVW